MHQQRRLCLAILALTVLASGIAWAFHLAGRHHPTSDSAIRSVEVMDHLSEPVWPQFRGATFDSHSTETGLAESWPEEGPPIVWTRELGQGYSGFIAVGNRVYTLTQSLYRQSLICLDVGTGDEIWAHHYGWPHDGGGLYPGPRSTPTWHDGRIFFAAPDGTIACVEADRGTPVWSCNPKKNYRGRGTDFGYASSPVVIDERLIVPVGGADASVVALDLRDGSVLWTSGQSSASYATPLPIRWHGRSLVVIPLENTVAVFDVATGKLEWQFDFSNGYDEHSAAPVYEEPYLVICSPFQAGAKQFQLIEDPQSPDQLSHPKNTWETPRFSNDVASSVLFEGRLYGFDLKDPQSRLNRPSKGEFRCVDFRTGKVIWSTKSVGQANVIVADNKLILFTDSGELILAKPGTDEYTELARTQIFRDEICWTYPALHRNCVYLRTQTRAVCVYLGQAPLTSPRPAKSVREISVRRVLDAKWLIGGEREFPATTPEWSEFLHWYGWSVLGIILGIAVASLLQFITSSRTNCRAGFWVTVLGTGLAGSPVINSIQAEYVLLWPLVLWMTYQTTFNAITWAESGPEPRQRRWWSRGSGLLFVATCLLYFHLCRSLGYAIEWSFLTGFLPAFPVAAIASRYLTSGHRWWLMRDLMASMTSFSAYFWFSVIFIKWRLSVGS